MQAQPHVRNGKLERIRSYLAQAAVLDLRALAVGRVGLALLILYDLFIRYGDIDAFYSDQGIEPRSEVTAPVFPLFRLYFLSGTTQAATALFVIAALAACGLLVGYRTKLSTIVSWAMLASLNARNGTVLQGGDDLLVMFLLWGAFLPLGHHWSIDARVSRREATSLRVNGVAPFAFYGQLFMLYFITGTLKLTSAHWRWGDGIYDALSADYFVTAFGQWVYPHYYLLKILSWGSLLLEVGGPLLFFIPPTRWKLRVGLVASFIAFHLGIAACMRLGMFSFVCVVGWLFLLPGEAFEVLRRSSHAHNISEATPYPRNPWERNLAAVLFAYLVLAAMVEDRWPEGPVRKALLKPAHVLSLQDHWGMFVKPRDDSGFLVVGALLHRGTQIDLMRKSQPLSWEQPKLVIDLFANQRWRKMLTNLSSGKHQERALRYLDWVCRTENSKREAPDKIAQLRLTYVNHKVGPRYQHGEDEQKLLAEHRCLNN